MIRILSLDGGGIRGIIPAMLLAELEQRSGDLFDWLLNGTLKVRIDREHPLERAAEAQSELAARRTTGKVLLTPTS